jgi:predicted GIY-YIG superfamily endonuclease
MDCRCVYAYEFSDKSVYVGLTNNFNRRKNQHNCDKGSSVNKHKSDHNSTILKQLTDYIDVNLAQIEEGNYVKKYEIDGWNVLNRAPTGGLGCGILKWNFDECKRVALLCVCRSELNIKFCGAYRSAKINGWLDDICSHMENKRTILHWTYEKCKKITEKYKNVKDFYTNNKNVYNACRRNGWLKELTKHMLKRR